MKKLILISTIGMLIISSCKKEINTPLPSPKPKYIYTVYDPPLSTGWEGQTSFENDSIFYLELNVDEGAQADFLFRIKEGSAPYYNGNNWTILPFQEVNVSASLLSWQLNETTYWTPSLDSGEVVGDTSFHPYSNLVLAQAFPNYYQFFPEGTRFLAIQHRDSDGNFRYGWIALRITGVNKYPWESRAVIYIESTFLSNIPNQPVRMGFLQ